MTLLHEAVNSKKLDTRVVERNIQRGLVRPEELQKSLKELPDDSDNAHFVNVEELAGEDDVDSNGSH